MTNDYYAYVNAHLTDNSNTAWVRTVRVPSSFSISVESDSVVSKLRLLSRRPMCERSKVTEVLTG